MCMMGGSDRAIAQKEVRYDLSDHSLCMSYICFYLCCSFGSSFERYCFQGTVLCANEMRLSFHEGRYVDGDDDSTWRNGMKLSYFVLDVVLIRLMWKLLKFPVRVLMLDYIHCFWVSFQSAPVQHSLYYFGLLFCDCCTSIFVCSLIPTGLPFFIFTRENHSMS